MKSEKQCGQLVLWSGPQFLVFDVEFETLDKKKTRMYQLEKGVELEEGILVNFFLLH